MPLPYKNSPLNWTELNSILSNCFVVVVVAMLAKYGRDLVIHTNCDIPMKTTISRTASSCFAGLRQIRSIPLAIRLARWLLSSRCVLLLRYGSNAVTSMISPGASYNDCSQCSIRQRIKYIGPYITIAAWPSPGVLPERIKFRLAVTVFNCRNSTTHAYVTSDWQWATDVDSRRHLRSASTH